MLENFRANVLKPNKLYFNRKSIQSEAKQGLQGTSFNTTMRSLHEKLKFGQESLQVTEKENSDYFDEFLNIDNIPEGGLQVKVVLKINSGNLLAIFVFDLGESHNQGPVPQSPIKLILD